MTTMNADAVEPLDDGQVTQEIERIEDTSFYGQALREAQDDTLGNNGNMVSGPHAIKHTTESIRSRAFELYHNDKNLFNEELRQGLDIVLENRLRFSVTQRDSIMEIRINLRRACEEANCAHITYGLITRVNRFFKGVDMRLYSGGYAFEGDNQEIICIKVPSGSVQVINSNELRELFESWYSDARDGAWTMESMRG